MKCIFLIFIFLTLMGCSGSNRPVSRFPASTSYVTYQAYVCRDLSGSVRAVEYDRLSKEAVTAEQINQMAAKVMVVAPDARLLNEKQVVTSDPCQCEVIASRSKDSYYLDRTMFTALSEQAQLALKSDMAIAEEHAAQAAEIQCEKYRKKAYSGQPAIKGGIAKPQSFD